MTNRFVNPVIKYTTATLKTMPGAELYFYITGTTTPKVTYQDFNGTIEHEHPVEALSDGHFPPIFLDGTYRAELKYLGVTQPGWPVDDVGATNDPAPLANWNSGFSYSDGELITGPDGNRYESLQDNNLNNDPTAPGSLFWSQIFLSGNVDSWQQLDIAARSGSGPKADAESAIRYSLDLPESTAVSFVQGQANGTYLNRTPAQVKSDIGLSNVDNTSDTSKPVSTAQLAALNLKANLISPAFSGNPTAPTPSSGDNDTSISTTAFTRTEVNSRTISNVAAMSGITPIVGQIYNLLEYSAGTNKGGGQVIGRSGAIVGDNILTFNAASGFYFERVGDVLVDSQMAGIPDTAVPSGGMIALNYTRDQYIGHSSGNIDLRNFLVRSQLNGPYGAVQVITQSFQSEYAHTAGTITFAYGLQGFSRLGRLGSSTGNITALRGVEWHTANEGSGSINSAYDFYAQDVDLGDGTGPIVEMTGFKCGDQGHATRITGSSIGFDCANFTTGAPITVAYRSQISGGTNRFAFLSTGGAASALAGSLRLGEATEGLDTLETKGFAKLSKDGTKTATGGYHEINSDQADYITHIKNTNASSPNGIRLRFTGASPNNTSREFLRCEDTGGTKMVIYSNGNLVNANNSYGAISDERLKVDISDAPSVLDKFRARQFKTYRIKESSSDELILGVIAQQELNISPNLVSKKDDGFYSYNYSGLAVESAQAIGELIKIIDDLKKQISDLEKRFEYAQL